MKTKKILLAGILFSLAVIAVYAFGFKYKSGNIGKQNTQQQYDFVTQDTTKIPEAITEKRSTQIEIINGKKKIKETVIKMKGDSIIEKKVIEKEEDGDDGLDMDFGQDNGISGGVHFRQFSPDDLDSLGMQNFGFNGISPFGNDSIFRQFGFGLGNGHNFNLGFPFSGMDEDFLKNFDNGFFMPNYDMTQLQKRMEELYKGLLQNKDNDDDLLNNNPFNNQKLPNVPRIYPPRHKNKSKSMNDIITGHLLNDGYINDIAQKYKFELNEKYLKINGKKQDKAIYDKYKKIIEDNTGIELEGEFNFKFTNKKKLGKKTMKI